MNVQEFLALPMQQSIRLRIGPRVEDAVNIDQLTFDARKQEVLDFCLGIPNIEGASWKLLKTYTGGNGLLAKVLIALGELAGAWKMHPRPEHTDLWSGHGMFPCVAHGSVNRLEVPSTVPKPSRGDLDRGVSKCVCCDRDMGPHGSKHHDIQASEVEGCCEECMGTCSHPDPCKVEPPEGVKKKTAGAAEQEPEEISEAMQAYLKNFEG